MTPSFIQTPKCHRLFKNKVKSNQFNFFLDLMGWRERQKERRMETEEVMSSVVFHYAC